MLTVKLNHASNFTVSQKAKLDKALALLQNVVNSMEFAIAVQNFTYNGKKQFVDNNGYDNGAIYAMIMNGKELLSLEPDQEIDVDITIYTSWFSRVIGYTYPDTLRTWVNSKYFNSMSIAGIASNIMHEWLHKIGFDHSFYDNASRPFSVPYAIGYLVEGIAKKIK